MRDDRNRWAAPINRYDPVTVGETQLQEVALTRQTLVSGPKVRETAAPLIGWPDIVLTDRYALCLRRDRVLIVNGPEAPNGWDPAPQQAVSDVTDGYRAFDLTGSSGHDVLRRGAELELLPRSPSVARQVFGLGCFVYRVHRPDHFRLHVSSAQGEALCGHLLAAMKAASEALPL